VFRSGAGIRRAACYVNFIGQEWRKLTAILASLTVNESLLRRYTV